MALKWADELDDTEPLPVLEPFFILAALELGDPDGEREWLVKKAHDFHNMYKQYRRDVTECGRVASDIPADSAAVLIQYMIWYPREASRLNSGKA